MMSSGNRVRLLFVTCAALFMAMLDNLVLGVALPSIQKSFEASVSDLQWFMNAYTLAFSVLLIPFSVLGDRYGRKKMFLFGVILFTVGSLSSALSQTPVHLILSRALQGIGGAAIIPLSLTLVNAAFPAHLRAAAIGLWSGISGLGLSIGPLVGGLIIKGAPWQMIFWINVPIGVLALVFGSWWLKESYGERKPVDLLGILFLAAGLFGIVFGLERGNREGWGDLTVWGPMAAGGLLLVLFYLWQQRQKQPFVQFRLFRSPVYASLNLAGFLMNGGIFGAIFLLTLFLQQAQGFSALGAGLREMAWTGVTMICAPLAGLFVSKLGAKPILLTGLLLQAGALFTFAVLIGVNGPHFSFLYMLPAMIAAGAGMGLSFTPLSHGVLSAVPEVASGEASGIHNMLRELGGVFGIAIGGLVFQRGGAITTPEQFGNHLIPALYVFTGMLLLGCASIVLLYRAGRSAEAAREAAGVSIGEFSKG